MKLYVFCEKFQKFKIVVDILKKFYKHIHAALAQLVERRLGKAEVGSSNLLGSFF